MEEHGNYSINLVNELLHLERTGLYLLNNKIWDKLLTNKSVVYRDIERYVYSEEYLKAFENFNFDFSGEEYNPFLVKYFFESEKYQNESDYEEVFFQRVIDGNISVQEYKKHENNFLNFMTELYKKSKAFAYYSLENPLCKTEKSKNYMQKFIKKYF